MADPATDPAVAAAIQQAIGQAVGEVSGQYAQLYGLTELLWRIRAYLCAAITILGWDILVTLGAEWKYFWKPKKITAVNVAFIFMRYWGLFTMAMYTALFFKAWTPSQCNRLHWLEPVNALILVSAAQFLVGARVYAIYEQSKLVLALFVSCWISGVVVQIWVIQDNAGLPVPQVPGLTILGCVDIAGPKTDQVFWVFWLPLLIYDGFAVALTVFKVYQYSRWSSGSGPLMMVILRDGLAYFFAIFAFNLLNVLWFKNRTAYGDHAMHVFMSLTLMVVLVSRMILNLRATSSAKTNYTTQSSGSYAISSRSGYSKNSAPLVHYPTNLPNNSRPDLNEKERSIHERESHEGFA